MDAYFDSAIIVKLYVREATSPDAIRPPGMEINGNRRHRCARSRQAAAGATGALEHDRAGGADLGGTPGGLPQRLGHRAVEWPRHGDLESAPNKG